MPKEGVPIIELIAFISRHRQVAVAVNTKDKTVSLTSRSKEQKRDILQFAERFGMVNPVEVSRHLNGSHKVTITICLGTTVEEEAAPDATNVG